MNPYVAQYLKLMFRSLFFPFHIMMLLLGEKRGILAVLDRPNPTHITMDLSIDEEYSKEKLGAVER